MTSDLGLLARAALIGIAATAVLDLWALLLKHAFGIRPPNWGLVGRWFGYFPRGRFAHDSIASSPPIPREHLIGWVAHYAIGIFYAFILFVIWGWEWFQNPTAAPALIVGLSTMVAPLFMMQPGMGAGVAASKTPAPNIARLKTITNHTVFSLGLFAAALLSAYLYPIP